MSTAGHPSIEGHSLIAGAQVPGTRGSFHAHDAATGEQLEPEVTLVRPDVGG